MGRAWAARDRGRGWREREGTKKKKKKKRGGAAGGEEEKEVWPLGGPGVQNTRGWEREREGKMLERSGGLPRP